MRGQYLELNYQYNSNQKDILQMAITEEYWKVMTSQVLTKLINKGVLEEEYQKWNKDGTGHGISYDLYGFSNGVVLLQERYVRRKYRNGFLNMKKTYYVTDGENIEKVSTPLKFLKKDNSMDGVMRYFAGKLSNESLRQKLLHKEYTNVA